MNVLDASVITDALASAGRHGDDARSLLAREIRLHVPSIVTAEVTSALRAMLRRGEVDAAVARQAAARACRLRMQHYPFEPFLARVWQLRDNVTAYDAWYIAVAEELGAALVTADKRLLRAAGPRCPMLSPTEALKT